MKTNNCIPSLKYTFIVFSTFAIFNLLIYIFIILFLNNIIVNIPFVFVITSSFVFCLFFFLFLLLVKPIIVNVVLYPTVILLFKIVLLYILGYTLETADFFIIFSENLSLLFFVFQYYIQELGIQSEKIEIFLHFFIMFLFQISILYLSYKIYKRWYATQV
jgi:hypothetical protein